MHAYVDGERFAGQPLDAALRALLAGFRLPGEAQKIDRIMEKFAARYCADNPAAFPAADAAYLLAFAVIMLNTDAHNPMAERRIGADDFVTMCMYQTEAGEFQQILPPAEIRALYGRIVAREIVVGGEAASAAAASAAAAPPPAAGGAAPAGQQQRRGAGAGSSPRGGGGESSRRARLAAAVGLGQLAAPLWAGNTWDKQHGVDVERRRLLEHTKELIAGTPPRAADGAGAAAPGGAAAAVWHTATHAEHARPMLQVCGGAVAKGLAAALAAAAALPAAQAVLEGYEQAVRLAALLRLERLCEGLVGGLAGAAALGAPAPPHSPAEARQVAALSRLVALGSCGDAGALGSAWVVLLRALSQLDALKASLMPGALAAAAASGGGGAGGGGGAPRGLTTRLLSRMGVGSSGDAAGGGGGGGAATVVTLGRGGDGARRGPLSVREAPGMGAALWAETAGAAAIDRVFAASASLDGDSVLTFVRALCAAGQEELDPGAPGAAPRLFLLQRLVECAYLNAARIRLVWQRLWTVLSQHLVSAACHADPYVAMFAVDALRRLADKLLCRAELAGFSTQGEALRPLASVLRLSDSPPVRELAAACVAHAAAAHAARLGSGWRSVVDALGVAAADPAPAVVTQALDAMAAVAEALYAPGGAGHALLRECAAAAQAAVRNEAAGAEDLSCAALYLFQASFFCFVVLSSLRCRFFFFFFAVAASRAAACVPAAQAVGFRLVAF
jgi:hypothetical protein